MPLRTGSPWASSSRAASPFAIFGVRGFSAAARGSRLLLALRSGGGLDPVTVAVFGGDLAVLGTTTARPARTRPPDLPVVCRSGVERDDVLDAEGDVLLDDDRAPVAVPVTAE